MSRRGIWLSLSALLLVAPLPSRAQDRGTTPIHNLIVELKDPSPRPAAGARPELRPAPTLRGGGLSARARARQPRWGRVPE